MMETLFVVGLAGTAMWILFRWTPRSMALDEYATTATTGDVLVFKSREGMDVARELASPDDHVAIVVRMPGGDPFVMETVNPTGPRLVPLQACVRGFEGQVRVLAISPPPDPGALYDAMPRLMRTRYEPDTRGIVLACILGLRPTRAPTDPMFCSQHVVAALEALGCASMSTCVTPSDIAHVRLHPPYTFGEPILLLVSLR